MHAIAEAKGGQDNNQRKDLDYDVTFEEVKVELAVTN